MRAASLNRSIIHRLAVVMLLCSALLFCAKSGASAQPSAAEDERAVAYPKPRIAAPRPAAHPEVEQWYGLPLAAVGVASVAVTLIGGAAQNDQAIAFGITTGATSGLLFHMLISQIDQLWWGVGKGLLSVALRIGLGLTGCVLGSGCAELTTAATTRLALGMLAGVALDAWLLATRTVKAPHNSTAQLSAAPAGCEAQATGISCRW